MVSEAEIDTAAYRILRARMMLGLFDDPAKNPYNALSPSIVGCEKHKNMALEAARQSLVLLKNEKNFLPINPKKVKSIAVVGINAGNCEFGDYSGKPINIPVSVLDGIRKRVGDDVKIVYAPWKSSSSGYELITKANFPNGLKAEYYNNKHLQGTPQVRIDENINFEPANQAPDPFLPESPLSIRWSGDLIPTVSGKYTLGFTTDDGCRLYIDGKRVIDSWKNRGLTTDSVVVTLEKDKKYRLVAEYFDNAGDASAKLYWRTPDFEKKALLDLYGDAKKAIQECDMTIAVMGINKSIEREGRDRDHIELPKDQQLFIEEAYKLNPKMAVVLVAGSSLAINWIDENIPAILNAWYPGEQGGTAVAEALFGDYSPAGRLPLTYYRSLDDLPAFDDYAIQKNRTYMYFTGKPLYAFGYGLSYTKFEYRKLTINQDAENVRLSFTIKNSGKYDSDEVSQVYVQFPEVGVKVPIKQLKGFERIHITKGKTISVTITVPKKELRIWNEKSGEFFTPSGSYVFMVGAASDDIRLQQVVRL